MSNSNARSLGWLVCCLLLLLGCAGTAQSKAGGMPSDYDQSDYAERPMAAPGATPEGRYGYSAEEEALVEEADASVAVTPASAPAPTPAGVPVARQMNAALPAPEPPPPTAAQGTPGANVESPKQKASSGPLLIYEATLTMAVFEAKKAIDAVEALARTSGGYLVTRSGHSIVIRIPSEGFQNALSVISKAGDELDRQVQVRDVTDQYHDLAIRIKNAEAMAERLRELLNRANNVQEALAVEAELGRVVGDIERMKGQLRLLSERIAFSTITVNFSARPVDKVQSQIKLPFPWLEHLGLGELLNL